MNYNPQFAPFGEIVVHEGYATEDDLKAIEKDVRAVVNAAAEFATTSPEPDPSELWTDVVVA